MKNSNRLIVIMYIDNMYQNTTTGMIISISIPKNFNISINLSIATYSYMKYIIHFQENRI